MRTLGLILCAAIPLLSQTRTVSITVDDLPGDAMSTRKLIAAFTRHHVGVTAFVIEDRVTESAILRQWIAGGFDLGNHTYSHPDINTLSMDQIEREVIRGESTVASLMQESGKKLTWFRFPMNHTGDTRTKHDAVAAFLAQRGYKLAACTIDNSDYLFNAAYLRMLASQDRASAKKLRAEYIHYTGVEIDYYAALNKQVLGYEPPQIMLLHDNRLNAEVIGQVLRLFEEKHYKFVTLAAAQSDPAYQTPDTYVTKFGPMWGYRWAAERKVKVDGRREPDPPKWILEYGKSASTP